MMRLNLSGQDHHKIASYNEDIITASFPRLINQDWNTDDFNIRITFRPKVPACLGTLALVTRYDFLHVDDRRPVGGILQTANRWPNCRPAKSKST